MAYYRSGFNAADERAKNIQEYITGFNNKDLTTQEISNLVLMGNALLKDTTLNTDYLKRYKKLQQDFKAKELERKRPYSKRIKAKTTLELQMEYITNAGVFGRPQLKVVSPTPDGKEQEILEILEQDINEDGSADSDTI